MQTTLIPRTRRAGTVSAHTLAWDAAGLSDLFASHHAHPRPHV